uniref:Putative cystatin iscys1 n=1 Tax=Ixodes scapularis TaxID=6945 RepID=A0A4D5RM30_IXOSC
MAFFKAAVFLVCVVLAAAGSASRSKRALVGGWKTQDPTNPKFENLAHYAVSTQVEGREYYDTVLELLEVQTQIVAGVNYKLKFTTTQSTCKIETGVEYSKELCQPKTNKVEAVCTAVIYTVPWQNIKRVLSYHCEAPNDV